MPVLIDRVDFIEPVRQVPCVAHVVDRLSHRPIGRHRDELGLHPPPGGVFRIQQTALKGVSLRWRQFLEDLLLVVFVEALEQFDGIIRFQFANTFGDGFRLELLEDFLADRIVDFVERRKMEILAGQFHKADPVFGFKRLDQIAEIGLMQLGHDFAQQRHVGIMNGARDLLDEFAANFAIFVAHRQALEHWRRGRPGNVHVFGHAAPRRFERFAELV